MTQFLLAIAALAVLGLLFLAWIELSRRLWTQHRVLAPTLGLAGLGITSMVVVVVFWVSPIAGIALSLAVVTSSIALLVLRRSWREWRTALPIALVIVGLALAYLGYLFLWQSGLDPFAVAQARFYSPMQAQDNQLPSLLAQQLWSGHHANILYRDWQDSDRPPLQSGMLLIFRSVAIVFHPAILGATTAAQVATLDFASSFVAQLTWIPAVYALLRTIRFSPRIAMLAVVFAAVVPVTFINSDYTWPKVLSGALIIAALTCLIYCAKDRTTAIWTIPLAIVLTTLGILSHGAAALTIPALILFGIIAIRGLRWRQIGIIAALGVGFFVVLYAPWTIYQTWIDPPGDRLLKWHIAGVIPIDKRTFLQALMDQYRSTPVSVLVHNRIVNLSHAFDVNVFQGAQFWQHGDLVRRRNIEFTETPIALELGLPLTVLMLGWAVVRRIQRRVLDYSSRVSVLLAIAMIGCIFIWALIMFIPGGAIVHQGSHVWMLVLLAVPFAWLAARSWRAGLIVLAVQAVLGFAVYLKQPSSEVEPLSGESLVVAIIGIAVVVIAMITTRRFGSNSDTTIERQPDSVAARQTVVSSRSSMSG